MDMNSWEMAFHVFIWGFGGVFVILVLLMWSIQFMSTIIRATKRPEKAYKKGEN